MFFPGQMCVYINNQGMHIQNLCSKLYLLCQSGNSEVVDKQDFFVGKSYLNIFDSKNSCHLKRQRIYKDSGQAKILSNYIFSFHLCPIVVLHIYSSFLGDFFNVKNLSITSVASRVSSYTSNSKQLLFFPDHQRKCTPLLSSIWI